MVFFFAKLGVGVGTTNSFFTRRYFEPYSSRQTTDIVLLMPFMAMYAQAEFRRYLGHNNFSEELSFYDKSFYWGVYSKTFFPFWYKDDFRNAKMRENHRLAVIVGYQKSLGKHKNWYYDFSFGPAM